MGKSTNASPAANREAIKAVTGLLPSLRPSFNPICSGRIPLSKKRHLCPILPLRISWEHQFRGVPSMEGPRVILLFILLFLFFSAPSTRPPTLSQQLELDHVIAEETHWLTVLNGSSYGDFDPPTGRWLNITGFRQHDSYAWDLLPHVK